jgi:hypothetical protein
MVKYCHVQAYQKGRRGLPGFVQVVAKPDTIKDHAEVLQVSLVALKQTVSR